MPLPSPRSCAFLVASLGALSCTTTDTETQPRPTVAGSRANVVVILADDLGYSDIGSYGAEIQTPHLDRLAEEGVPLTQFRNSGRCCPSRASLLTGPLGDAGYHTCISGKWHVGTDER